MKDRPFLQELLDCMLSERPEVAEVQIEDDRFDVCYHLDFCANCREKAEETEAEENRPAKNHQTRLSDLLTTHWENVHLLYEIWMRCLIRLRSWIPTPSQRRER